MKITFQTDPNISGPQQIEEFKQEIIMQLTRMRARAQSEQTNAATAKVSARYGGEITAYNSLTSFLESIEIKE